MDIQNPYQVLTNASRPLSASTLSYNISLHDVIAENTTIQEKMKSHIEYKIAEKIWQIGPVVLFILGTVGNVWTLIIMRTWDLGRRSNNMQIYMIFLAISDLLVLYSGLLRNWINWTFGRDIRALSLSVCRGHTFLVYVSISVSAWLLVMMTLERTCSACMPTRVNSLCTRRRAYVTIVVIIVIHCCLHLHFLILLPLREKENVKRTTNGNFNSSVNESEDIYICDTAPGDHYSQYVHVIWPILDVFLLSIIPSILVFLGNLIIVWKAKVSLWTAEELSMASNNRARRKRFSSMTIMLGLISILFISTSLPTCVYNVWERSKSAEEMGKTPRGLARLELCWAFVNIAMYCNNTFNFYLYLLSGRKFRKAVSRQISRRRTESQSNVISGYSFQLQPRFNQHQESRNGHAMVNCGSVHKRFQLNPPAGKQFSVKYKPCETSNHSNAYL